MIGCCYALGEVRLSLAFVRMNLAMAEKAYQVAFMACPCALKKLPLPTK